ncbi:hypothetical protein JCGZ_15154 [Jatropha curcas]|uniref:Anthocyanidin 3-O-glucosyltransferase n=1 Tax=Jatropha curcas TaxID=180498 RepID=A0A067LLP3_JATCU|nr:hypothetical protein JCGZ_15154 [Jatropha curcas]
MTTKQDIHVVMFPWFAFGHISPFVQLSNKLSFHGFRITFLSPPGNIQRIKSSLLLTQKAQIIALQIPPVDGLPIGFDSTSEMAPYMAELLKQALDLMKPQIENLLSQINPDFVFLDSFNIGFQNRLLILVSKLCSFLFTLLFLLLTVLYLKDLLRRRFLHSLIF